MVLNLVTPGEFFKFFFCELPSKVLQMKELQFIELSSEKGVLHGRKHYEKTYSIIATIDRIA